MSSVKRCITCNGKKKVAPLGFIQKECPACGGIGYTSKDEKLVNDEVQVNGKIPPIKPIKRRGRPPSKVIND